MTTRNHGFQIFNNSHCYRHQPRVRDVSLAYRTSATVTRCRPRIFEGHSYETSFFMAYSFICIAPVGIFFFFSEVYIFFSLIFPRYSRPTKLFYLYLKMRTLACHESSRCRSVWKHHIEHAGRRMMYSVRVDKCDALICMLLLFKYLPRFSPDRIQQTKLDKQ